MKTINMQKGFNLQNETGKLAQNIADNWLIGLRETNPAILDMFHERDKKPYRDLLPWSGEFAGKYITGAYYIYKLTHDDILYKYIMNFIDELLDCIDEDGYIGCYSKECHLTGAFSQNPSILGGTWDAWSNYHVMYGLFMWYIETKQQRLFDAVEKIAGLFLKTFYDGGLRLVDIGSTEMNLAPLHIFTMLYLKTKDERYLSFVREIEKDLSTPNAGNYIEHSLKGLEYFECPKPRWESLHVIMGIALMGECTNNQKYYEASKQIFYSILKTDIHNTGGFSTEEQAIGNPFVNGNVELCCVIAYNAFACDMLKLTGDMKIADFLELSLYNAVMGSFSPTGAWSTYNTPMEGIKNANYHSIVFQSRSGSPNLNCCSVNAARGVGMLSEWAFMQENATVYINYFENCALTTHEGLEIKIIGEYPVSPDVQITLKSTDKQRIAIRIPLWSAHTTITVQGKTEIAKNGEYFYLDTINNVETIEIHFDFTPHFVEGANAYQGKKSIYVGPILYGYDLSLDRTHGVLEHRVQPHINSALDFDNLPSISVFDLKKAVPFRRTDGHIILNLSNITLCDFYHLGVTGSQYKTWFTCE